MDNERSFENVRDALAFLDDERKALEAAQIEYNHHVRELITQLVSALDSKSA